MAKLSLSEVIHTNKISDIKAEDWLEYLLNQTDKEIRKRFAWNVRKGHWPMRAVRKWRGERNPKFVVNHHTGGSKTNPVIYRFLQSKKASSQAVIERNGNILTLAHHKHACYHAVPRTNSPLRKLAMRRLLNIELGWLNEYGIETIGNGNKWLFTPEQFISIITLQRLLISVFPTIKCLKSHREFSPTSRAGDPGPLYFLPLVEHAVFNDVDLEDPNYWIQKYKEDPIEFANKAVYWFEEYGVTDRDEWKRKRHKPISKKHLL